MSLDTLLIQVVSLLLSIVGQFLLKAGALALGQVGMGNVGEKLISMALQPYLWAGISMYGLSAVGYIIVLSRTKLSIAAPTISISYVIITLGGALIFQEPLPLIRFMGVVVIVVGVLMVLLS
ncbi:EamA domain-containing protein [Tumidithrix helvetica PCC 7403]|uniref:transporter n=1 Tax=Tumidithrix helvetica TaxID=3457545 RepID=UPI003CBBF457